MRKTLGAQHFMARFCKKSILKCVFLSIFTQQVDSMNVAQATSKCFYHFGIHFFGVSTVPLDHVAAIGL